MAYELSVSSQTYINDDLGLMLQNMGQWPSGVLTQTCRVCSLEAYIVQGDRDLAAGKWTRSCIAVVLQENLHCIPNQSFYGPLSYFVTLHYHFIMLYYFS